jgi:hypothetical protein
LANVLFVQGAVEELPEELNGVANELHVRFPWGSLLRAVATGDPEVLGNLRRICSSGADLEVMIGLDPERDQAQIARLALPSISRDYVETDLVPKYRASGFEIVETGILLSSSWTEIESSWAKRLRGNDARVLVYFRAERIAIRKC